MSTGVPAGAGWDLVVDRRDLRRTAVVASRESGDLAPGQALMRVDAFALTANNLTYAVTGEQHGYWQLFPAPPGWGRVPAWGTVTVIRSACPDVRPGDRFAGMVPMSSHLVTVPRPARGGVVDLAAHRAQVNPVYNRYARVEGRTDQDLEQHAGLRPVFVLSFVLAHHLRSQGWSRAARLLVTSASSKAAMGLAHVCAADDVLLTGLTSSRHRDDVVASGLFDEVLSYDQVDALEPGTPTLLVDVSGNRATRDRVGEHLGARLVDVVQVGQTDWDQPADDLLGSAAGMTPFFAPTAIQELVGQWGPAVFAERLDHGLQAFAASTAPWLRADHRDGPDEVAQAFADVLDGRVPPDRYVIVRP